MLRTQGAASDSEQSEILGFIGFAQHSRIIPFTYRLWQWFHGTWVMGKQYLKKTHLPIPFTLGPQNHEK